MIPSGSISQQQVDTQKALVAQQEALALPVPGEHVSLMAHDLLTLASMGEIFLSWPLREAGSPSVTWDWALLRVRRWVAV